MNDSGIVVPEEYRREIAREMVNGAADNLPLVGQPREDQSHPRTIKILPDMSVLVWHHASVEARGGLCGADGKPLKKLGLVLDMLSPDEGFDFFHRNALNFAEYLVQRDKMLEEAKAGADAKPEKKQRASKKERKARRKKLKGRKR